MIDIVLLTFFNQTLAHPLLDWIMIGLTTGGFTLLPASGMILLLSKRQRRTGLAVLLSLLVGLILTLIFQYLAFRPRPEAARLILAQPNVPSYPSGHATAAFSAALVIGLTYRRPWRWFVFGGAGLIALSRVYLGHHYPSDILGGAILGTAVGATCYGLVVVQTPGRLIWRWFLWLQVAVALLITHMAYLEILPLHLLRWSLADKVLHFLLIGSIAFWLNLWLNGRKVHLGPWSIPLALLIPFTVALLEEGAQHFSPARTASLLDLFSDSAGLLFFWWASQRIIEAAHSTEALAQSS